MAQFKAQAHMSELQQRLTLSFNPAAVFTLSYDSNFFPILQVVVEGETQFIYIQAEPDNSGHVNALGLPQQVFSPHQVSLLRSTADDEASVDARFKVENAIAKLGMKYLLYEVAAQPPAATNAAAVALMVAGNLVSISRSDEINPETESQ